MIKRFGWMVGAVLALSVGLAAAAVAMPLDVLHPVAGTSPSDVGATMMLASVALGLPIAEKRAPQVGEIVDYIVPVFAHDTPAVASRHLKAEIVHVWSDTCVNLKVTSADGSETFPCSVLLVQGTMPRPAGGYATYPAQAANDSALEREIQSKGLTAPRVTPSDIEAVIVSTRIVKHVADSGQVLRWAVLTCRNGFAVAGKPSCAASPENDNEDLGERLAIQNARDELWPLLGYELKSKLAA